MERLNRKTPLTGANRGSEFATGRPCEHGNYSISMTAESGTWCHPGDKPRHVCLGPPAGADRGTAFRCTRPSPPTTESFPQPGSEN